MDVRSIGMDVRPEVTVEQPLSPRELADRRQLIRAVQAINQDRGQQVALGQHNELTYSFDRETRRTILKIVNRETQEVVRQIPSEDVLQLAASLQKRDGR